MIRRLLSKPEVKALYTNRYAAGYGRSRLGNEASLRSNRDATIRRDPQKPGKSMDSGDRAPSVSRIDKVTIRRDPQKHGKSMDSGDRAPSVNRIDNRRSKEH